MNRVCPPRFPWLWTSVLGAAALWLLSPAASAQQAAPAAVPAQLEDGGRGPRVVVVPAPASPWAVVQLHLGAGLAPAEHRAALPEFAQALAFGAAQYTRDPAHKRVHEAGGEVRVRVTADEVVVSDGVPADALSEALRAMEQRLRTRTRLLPAEAPVATLPGPTPLPAQVRRALVPASSPQDPPPAAAPDAKPADSFRPLADALFLREEVVVVVIGPGDADELSRLVKRTLRTTLPARKTEPAGPLVPAAGEHVVVEETARAPARGPYSWFWLAAPGAGFSSDEERRAYALAAHLVGGEAAFTRDLGWVSLHVPRAPGADAAAAEAAALARLQSLATAPDAAATTSAVAALRGERWRALRDPTQLALELGRETRMRGAPVPLAATFEGALPDDVARAATALLAAPRVVLRHDRALEEDK